MTPGTHYVTLGGMVAADVHGKNHHVDGCFGEHVPRLRMRVADGRILECSDDDERELFRATLGGMGLTGHILEVEFRLRRIPSPWIWQESERTPNFDATLERLREASQQLAVHRLLGRLPHARTRTLGRGMSMKGRWAEPGEAPPPTHRSLAASSSVPPIFPSWLLQPLDDAHLQPARLRTAWRPGAHAASSTRRRSSTRST